MAEPGNSMGPADEERPGKERNLVEPAKDGMEINWAEPGKKETGRNQQSATSEVVKIQHCHHNNK